MTETKNLPRIERGTTKIVVPHEQGEIAFAWPVQGPHNYQTVGRGIIARRLNIPNGEGMASLLHSAYCSNFKDEPEFKEIKNIMKNNWLWVFNRNVWTPNGLYVADDFEAKGLSEQLNPAELEEKLKGGTELSWGGIRFSKDRNIRFAPKGSYSLGEQTPDKLTKQGDVIANYGVDGANKLGEVASKFKYNPITYGLNINKDEQSVQRVAALDSDVNGDRLRVDGYWFDYGNGYGFGVSN